MFFPKAAFGKIPMAKRQSLYSSTCIRQIIDFETKRAENNSSLKLENTDFSGQIGFVLTHTDYFYL